MTRLHRPALLAPLALAWLIPTEALAYYPCDGAGPGEVIVGMEPNGPGQPETPLCEYVGEEGDGGDPGGHWVEQFAALAWGQDGNGNPTYSWYMNATSMAEAETSALAQCRGSGFADCVIATSVANGAIAIAVDQTGRLHADWGDSARQAEKKALRYCRQQGGTGCKIEKTIESPAAWVSN